MKNIEYIKLNCKKCNIETTGNKAYLSRYKKTGKICEKCLKKQSSETLRKIRERQSPEERSVHSKKARAKVNSSLAVKKQWETIKNDPILYKKICKSRKERMERVWENYSSKQKDFILTNLVSSNGKSRSKLSDFFKNKLIENNCYDNFESEQNFHGFFPDEINHKLKIIIEVFGDIYHCNPRKYKNENEYLSFINRTVGEQWLRDRKKLASYYKNGYSVIVVWECDIYNNIEKEINRVKDEINKKRRIKSIF